MAESLGAYVDQLERLAAVQRQQIDMIESVNDRQANRVLDLLQRAVVFRAEQNAKREAGQVNEPADVPVDLAIAGDRDPLGFAAADPSLSLEI